jgi:hypothetical protein
MMNSVVKNVKTSQNLFCLPVRNYNIQKQIERNNFEQTIDKQKISQNLKSFFEELNNAKQEKFNLMREFYGFSLEIKKSTIKNAGNGVFIKGNAPKGSLVAIYPGKIHYIEKRNCI